MGIHPYIVSKAESIYDVIRQSGDHIRSVVFPLPSDPCDHFTTFEADGKPAEPILERFRVDPLSLAELGMDVIAMHVAEVEQLKLQLEAEVHLRDAYEWYLKKMLVHRGVSHKTFEQFRLMTKDPFET